MKYTAALRPTLVLATIAAFVSCKPRRDDSEAKSLVVNSTVPATDANGANTTTRVVPVGQFILETEGVCDERTEAGAPTCFIVRYECPDIDAIVNFEACKKAAMQNLDDKSGDPKLIRYLKVPIARYEEAFQKKAPNLISLDAAAKKFREFSKLVDDFKRDFAGVDDPDLKEQLDSYSRQRDAAKVDTDFIKKWYLILGKSRFDARQGPQGEFQTKIAETFRAYIEASVAVFNDLVKEEAQARVRAVAEEKQRIAAAEQKAFREKYPLHCTYKCKIQTWAKCFGSSGYGSTSGSVIMETSKREDDEEDGGEFDCGAKTAKECFSTDYLKKDACTSPAADSYESAYTSDCYTQGDRTIWDRAHKMKQRVGFYKNPYADDVLRCRPN